MHELQPRPGPTLTVRGDAPLIGVVVKENGYDVTHYFTDEEAADTVTAQLAAEEALSAIGSWSDLDWGEMETSLDRIRHDSPPTPPAPRSRQRRLERHGPRYT